MSAVDEAMEGINMNGESALLVSYSLAREIELKKKRYDRTAADSFSKYWAD